MTVGSQNMKYISSLHRIMLVLVALLLAAWPAWAGPQTTIGPYQVEVTTDPATIPVGKANLRLKITVNGQPVENATVRTLTKMPSMDMGERQEIAMPQAEPGVYLAPAAFSMAGPYSTQIEISGPQGQAQGAIHLETGQSTGGSDGNSSLRFWLLGIVGVAVVVFVIYRMKRTGQSLDARAVLTRPVLGGLALLGAMIIVAVYAVNHFRRPGSMTPIEAQGMEMNMPAPSGVLPVELATVTRGSVQNTVRYTGQAVGFLEQDVYPRVQGELEYMPFYAGDKVKKRPTSGALRYQPTRAPGRRTRSGCRCGRAGHRRRAFRSATSAGRGYAGPGRIERQKRRTQRSAQ